MLTCVERRLRCKSAEKEWIEVSLSLDNNTPGYDAARGSEMLHLWHSHVQARHDWTGHDVSHILPTVQPFHVKGLRWIFGQRRMTCTLFSGH
eukprot:1637016-Heterocapsa_arctica.AAC.1